MKLTKKIEQEVLKVYNTGWEAYLRGDLKTHASCLSRNFKIIGTTEAEHFNSKKAWLAFCKKTIHQVVGVAQLRNRKIKLNAVGDGVMVEENSAIYVLLEGKWQFYSKIRITALMQKENTGWKYVHQHGSLPDTRANSDETIATKQIKKENQQLREAVKRRTIELEEKNRELEIEASLERVRTVAMAMRKPEDMLQICKSLYTELHTLGFGELRNSMINVYDDFKSSFLNYDFSGEAGLTTTSFKNNSHPVIENFIRQVRKTRDAFAPVSLSGKKLSDFIRFRELNGEKTDLKLRKAKAIHYYFYSIGNGSIGISTLETIPDEQVQTLKRFRNVFEIAYQRYTDISLAEAQAREAQIELALERVRARTMAMQKSEELTAVSEVLRKEMGTLGVEELETSSIYIVDDTSGTSKCWYAIKDVRGKNNKLVTDHMTLRLDETWVGRQMKKFLRSRETRVSIVMQGENRKEWINYCADKSSVLQGYYGGEIPERTYHLLKFSNGFMGAASSGEISTESWDLLQRATAVFSFAFKRFSDLQKAEAQAREAEIELALERVRARTMAMHTSSELAEVATLLFEQVKQLGIETYSSGFNIWDSEHKNLISWMSNPRGVLNPPFEMPIHTYDQHMRIYESWKDNETVMVDDLGGEALGKHYRFLRSFPLLDEAFSNSEKAGIKTPDRQVHNIAFFSNGFLLFITSHPHRQAHDIFKRLAKVFDQTYTRFLDLKKAEAQAREAQIEVAVERVRAQSMAMHHPDDLDKVNKELLNQLNQLQIPGLTGVTFYLINESGWVNAWDFSSPGNIGAPNSYTLQFDFTKYEMMGEPFRALLKSNQDYYVADYPLEKLEKAVYEIEEINPAVATVVKEALASGILTHQWSACARISSGLLGIDLVKPPSEDTRTIVLKMAGAFNQAYTRFLDLQKAEAQAREAQIEVALERVRALTMAMHNSEDVGKCIVKMFSELTALGVDEGTRFGIGILNHENENIQLWTARKDGEEVNLHIGSLDMNWHPLLKSARKAWQAQVPLHQYVLEGEDLVNYYRMINQAPDYKLQVAIDKLPEREFHYGFVFDHGFFYAFNLREFQPDLIRITHRFSALFEQTYRRYLDLVKAEAQAREAQIEAALEKVRARTMAMRGSDELLDVASILFQQVKALGVPQWNCGFNIWEIGDKEFTYYPGTPDGIISQSPCKIPLTEHPVFKSFDESRKRGDELFVYEKEGELQRGHYQYMLSLPGVGDLLQNMLDAGFEFPTFQIDHIANFGYGNLIFITYEHFPEMHDVFKRFAKVFEQTYTRFLDLQKAEAQARESKIETALERVRAQAMAMHHSDDLGKTIGVYFEQLDDLMDSTIVRCGAGLLNKENTIADMSTASKSPEGETYTVKGRIDMRGHPLLENTYAHWLKQEEYSHVLRGNEIKEYYQYITNQVAIPENKGGDELHFYFPMFTEGSFYVVTNIEVPEDELQIFRRFSSVLSLTYRRFNDLQKAESQAREAQIETALERVRSRTMGMQNSEELPEVANLLFTEVRALGIHAWSCGYNILAEDRKSATCWMSSEGTLQTPFQLRLWGEASFDEMGDFIRSEKTFLVQELGDNAIDEHYAYMKSFPDLKPTFDQIDALGLSLPTHQINHLCKFTQGFLLFITYEKVPEAHDIFKRFTKVFEQTYTRFLDLKKAEAQATEATRQASLDRVRGEIASMRTTDDLQRITPLIWRELITLGVPFFRCGVFIIDEHDQRIHAYLSTPEGKSLAVLHLPFDSNETNRNAVEHWREQKVYTDHWDRQQFQAWAKAMMEQHQIEGEQQYQAGETPPESLSLQFIPFKQGMLYVGSSEPLAEDQINLVKSLADAFSVAYARYEDFKQLEDAKNRVEATLTELKATQSQLVQSEKMASLGELTAGIAHEIQNPLNFVNNFSEVSNELLDEMKEEIDKGNYDEVKAITNDVKQNLEKILHHGKRADGIVKGMLQHSRSSSGQRELTDINALADEYLRLAYHGLRAKDKSFNAKFETRFDESLEKVEVVPQDIGRVILNLITNAFYAVTERKKQQPDGYEPTVIVSSRKVNNYIEVSVKDNGNGIPQKILDKIFQPFFTTKPTGQGTGLGLSLSYDIVKAHAGEIKVESKEGNGTAFVISLPTQL